MVCVKVLVVAGVGRHVLESQNLLGDTCLHGAAWGGHADVLKLLIEHYETTPAQQHLLTPDEAAQPQLGLVKWLVMKNKQQQTAMDLAKNAECGGVLQQALFKARSSVSQPGSKRNSRVETDQEEDDD